MLVAGTTSGNSSSGRRRRRRRRRDHKMEGGGKSMRLVEFLHCDPVAGCSDQAGSKEDSRLAVCEDGFGFVGDGGIDVEEGRL